MATYHLLAVVLVAAIAQVSGRARIVGGADASLDRFPSVVQVENNIAGFFWTQRCAGCILNELYIVSAAQCFSGSDYAPENRRIRAGSVIREEGGLVREVATEIIHGSYGTNGNEGDIAVVRLTDRIIYTANIQPARLIVSGFVLPPNYPVSKVGWGVTSVNVGEYSETLQVVDTTVSDLALCQNAYGSLSLPVPITSNMICSGNPVTGGQDACTGDNGGPMYVDDILVGVISFGNGCGRTEYPGVSIQVSSYTNWIVSVAV